MCWPAYTFLTEKESRSLILILFLFLPAVFSFSVLLTARRRMGSPGQLPACAKKEAHLFPCIGPRGLSGGPTLWTEASRPTDIA